MSVQPKAKLALFGATGRTGRQLLLQLKERGLDVAALAREPLSLGDLEDSQVTKGDVMDPQAVRRVIAGSTAVLSAIGRRKDSPIDMMTVAAVNIVTAMREQHVDRLVVLSNTAVEDAHDRPSLVHRVIRGILPRMNSSLVRDSLAAAQIVADSNLDWTIVRAPLLTDGPRTGKCHVGPLTGSIPVRISRADVAEFMLACVLEGKFSRESPAIGSSGLI